MRITARWVGLVYALAGCGPTVGVPGESESGGTTAAGTTAGEGAGEGGAVEVGGPGSNPGTNPSTSTGTPPNPTATTDAPMPSTGSSETTTGLSPEEGVLGDWLCESEMLPLFLRVQDVDGVNLSGSLCAPSDQGGAPPAWDICDEIRNHLPIGFVFQILATLVGEAPDPYEVEFGFNYVAETDTLEGVLFPLAPPAELIEQTCERYVE